MKKYCIFDVVFWENLFFHDKCKKPKLGKKEMDWFMSDCHSDRQVMPHGMAWWHAFSEHWLKFYIWLTWHGILTWHGMPFIFDWHGMVWHVLGWRGKKSVFPTVSVGCPSESDENPCLFPTVSDGSVGNRRKWGYPIPVRIFPSETVGNCRKSSEVGWIHPTSVGNRRKPSEIQFSVRTHFFQNLWERPKTLFFFNLFAIKNALTS